MNAPSAFAHAYLVSSNPAHGSVLDRAPAQVEVTFSEDISLPNGSAVAVRVADRDLAEAPSVNGSRLTIPIRDGGTGVYLVTWRIISSDSHSISGSIQFGVGVGVSASSLDAAPPEDVVEPVRPWEVLARILGYVGLVGVAIAAIRAVGRTGILLSSAALVTSAAIRFGADVATRGELVFATGVGAGAGLTVVAALISAVLPASTGARTSALRWAAVAIAALGVVAGGHAWPGGVPSLAIGWAHAFAAAVWFAAVAATLLGGPPRRTTAFAAVAIGTLILTGVAQSIDRVHWWDALTQTDYGRLVLIKVALAAFAIALGGIAARRRAAGRPTALESAVLATAFGVAGVLASTPIAAAVFHPVARVEAEAGPYSLTVDVEPARIGPQRWKVVIRPGEGAQAQVRSLQAVLADGTRVDFPIRVPGSAPPGAVPETTFIGRTSISEASTTEEGRLILEVDAFTSYVARIAVPLG
ncbi:copper resistance CopC/CopD family protein [Tsukamurella asaccharolytica]|uniref:copper resistance CopC/CopD family protein n=1 Tax=Tsukamurella asaccharolytica TaxID=2592067 RepID=UPI00131516DB|nr:copper resistance CopC family protein [Tsukamurella asaccharolytica]